MNVGHVDKGREALKYFHNRSSYFDNYDLSFDQLLDRVSVPAGYDINKSDITPDKFVVNFLDGLGSTIDLLKMNSTQIKSAMEKLADKAQGRIPKTNTGFFQALSGEVSNVSFIEAVPFVIRESAKEIGNGLVEVGQSAISTLKTFGIALPFLLIGGAALFIYAKVK